MLRKFRIFALATLVGLAAMTPYARAETPTIHWLEWWDDEWGKAVMTHLVQAFQEKTGIKVERTGVPWGNMYPLLVTNAQLGTAKYDVVGMEGCCWLSGIDKLGGLEPLGGYLKQEPAFAASLTPMTSVRWLGRTMMLNLYIFPYSYVYNVDLFKKAGVPPPADWGEVIKASRAIVASKAAPYGLGTAYSESDVSYIPYYLFGSRLAQLGGKWYHRNGTAAFNSPQGVAALEWWKKLTNSGVLAPGFYGMDKTTLREEFANGKIAAFWGGPFEATIAEQANPNLHVAYAPPWCDVTCGYQWAGSGIAIAANSRHKQEAWKFIQFLLSTKTSLYLTKTLGIPFASKTAVASLGQSSNPVLDKIPLMLTKDPSHNLLLLPTPDYERLHRAFCDAFLEVMRGQLQPKPALDKVAAIWDRALKDTAGH